MKAIAILLLGFFSVIRTDAQIKLDSNKIPSKVLKAFNNKYSPFAKNTTWFYGDFSQAVSYGLHPTYLAFFEESNHFTEKVLLDTLGNIYDIGAEHLDSVPKIVLSKFYKLYPMALATQWGREWSSSLPHYVVTFFMKMQEYAIRYDSLGKMIHTLIIIPPDSLPLNAITYLKQNYRNYNKRGNWGTSRINFDSSYVKTYDVAIYKDDYNAYSVIFDATGNFLSTNVIRVRSGRKH